MGNKKINIKKVIKASKPNRNEVAVNRKKEEVASNKRKVTIIQKKDFIKNQFNGEYYLARMNMLADQLNNKILEKIDGCPKSKEYMRAEYALMRMQSIDSFRNAHFAKENLKNSGLNDEDIEQIRLSYFEDKVIKENYDGEEKTGRRAEFVN